MLLIILIILLLCGGFGTFPGTFAYNTGWNHAPFGIVSIIVVILIILAVTGRL